jgi:hypothetical protein
VTDAERRAAELVKRTAEVPPRAMDVAHGWDGVLERATRPRRQPWLVPAGAVAVMVGVVVGFLLMRTQPVVVAAAGTQWEQRVDGGVQLQAGRVQTSRAVDLDLESPQVSIIARSCRFAAEVVTEGTRVTIFEGEAAVRSGEGEERVLRAGESALWPALPAIPRALEAPEAAPPQACAAVELAKRSECLETAAKGEGLEAEVALFELGRLQARAGNAEAAVQAWRASLSRFPEGVFGPEARLALLVALTQQRRFAEALTVAREFEAAYPDDPRSEDVHAVLRQLEWRARQR